MSKLTHEQLDIQDAFEHGDLMPFFEEYILKNKNPPKDLALRLSHLMKERGQRPILVQARRGPSKKAVASLAQKVEFFEYQQTLRNEMSALEAKESAAKLFGINARKADQWNADARDFYRRLNRDGKKASFT
jgi:hypothetical protein